MHFGTDRGKLAAVFGQQFLNRDLRLLHLGGIILALWRKPHFGFFEAVEHIAGRDRTQSGVVDLPDRRALLDIDVDDPALGGLLALKPEILEVSRIPQRVEVTLDRRLVVYVTHPGEDSGLDGFLRNSPAAVNLNLDDQILLPEACRAQQEENQDPMK